MNDLPEFASGPADLVPMIDSSNLASLHSSEDAPPSGDAIDIAIETEHSKAEEFEDIVPLASVILPPLESTPQLEAAVDPPVQLVPACPEPITLPAENGSAPASPDIITPMDTANIPQIEAVHVAVQLACSSPEPEPVATPFGGSNVVATSSSEHVAHGDISPSNNIRVPVEVDRSDQSTCAPEPFTSLKPEPGPELEPSRGPDADPTPRPYAEATRAPAHVARTPSERRAPHIDNDLGCVPSPIRPTPSFDGAPQAEEVPSPVQLTHTISKSATLGGSGSMSNSDPHSDGTHPQLEEICPPIRPAPPLSVPSLPPMDSSPALLSGTPAPDRVSTSSARPYVQVKAVRPLVEPLVPAPKSLTIPHVEATRPLVQISRTLLEPHTLSVIASGVPPSQRNYSSIRMRSQIEAPHNVVQLARAPPNSRNPSSGNESGPTNGALRPPQARIKSHPKKIVTTVGQRRPTALSGQMVPPLPMQQASQSILRPVERSATSFSHGSSNAVPVVRQEKTSDSSYHSPIGNSSLPGTIPEIDDEESKSFSGSQPKASQKAPPAALINGAINTTTSVASSGSSRGSPMTTQEPSGQSRHMAPQLAMQPSDQRTRLTEQPRTSLESNKKTSGVLPHTPAPSPQAAAAAEHVSGGVTIPSPLLGHVHHMPSMTRTKHAAGQQRQSTTVTPAEQVRSRSQSMIRLPGQYATSTASIKRDVDSTANVRQGRTAEVMSKMEIPVTAADIRSDYKSRTLHSTITPSAPSAWNGTTRISSRIKTKDLINRHKPQIASDGRPLQIHSPSRSSTSGTAQISPLTSKPGANRVDSGIELWDYESRGDIYDDRSGHNASANRYCNPTRDRGSLRLKESRTSLSGLQMPPQVTAGSFSTNPPVTMPLGRREPFINRKPQPASHCTIATAPLECSTPPRPSTPSSTSNSVSVTTCTQETLVTPATSFSLLPSRGPSPSLKAAHRSWFRRIVIDPVKATLGYDPPA
ncbi:hypothetical protein BGW80DRAFT_238408 [Lactifluus volemus]|nr:hypothetical protein BGW80DRAFT_238408 [Lactifluus volemus]